MPDTGDRGFGIIADWGCALISLRNTPFLFPALLHAGLIYFLSSQPLVISVPYFPHMDKLAHALSFGLLAFLMAWGLFRVYPEYSTRRVLSLTLLAGVLYGALDEGHQYFVPLRQTDPLDLAADGVGVLLVVIAWWYWRRNHPPVAE